MGKFEGFGFNVNIPLPNGSGDLSYKEAFSEIVIPEIDQYGPNMIIFVIGQDSSQVRHTPLSMLVWGYHRFAVPSVPCL